MQKAPSSFAAGSPEEAQAKIKDVAVARHLFGKQHKRSFDIFEDIMALPRFSQTQRSLNEQLEDLRVVAHRFGLYDAADFIREIQEKA